MQRITAIIFFFLAVTAAVSASSRRVRGVRNLQPAGGDPKKEKKCKKKPEPKGPKRSRTLKTTPKTKEAKETKAAKGPKGEDSLSEDGLDEEVCEDSVQIHSRSEEGCADLKNGRFPTGTRKAKGEMELELQFDENDKNSKKEALDNLKKILKEQTSPLVAGCKSVTEVRRRLQEFQVTVNGKPAAPAQGQSDPQSEGPSAPAGNNVEEDTADDTQEDGELIEQVDGKPGKPKDPKEPKEPKVPKEGEVTEQSVRDPNVLVISGVNFKKFDTISDRCETLGTEEGCDTIGVDVEIHYEGNREATKEEKKVMFDSVLGTIQQQASRGVFGDSLAAVQAEVITEEKKGGGAPVGAIAGGTAAAAAVGAGVVVYRKYGDKIASKWY